MNKKFSIDYTLRDLVRSYQNKDESCADYLVRVKKMGEELEVENEILFEIAIKVLRKYIEDVELLALNHKTLTESFIKQVEIIEKIKKEAWARKQHRLEQKGKINLLQKNKQQIMNVETVEDIIKDNTIYINNYNFRLIKDTGSEYNFVTYNILRKLKVMPQKLMKHKLLYTCLLEPFKCDSYIEKDNYSLPRIEEILYSLKQFRVFSKIDLKEGFFQVILKEEDRHKTAFRIKNKTYEWTRMPMSFKNAPAIFQRIMDMILEEEIGSSCYVCVDDIIICGEDEKDHEEKFIKICQILNDAGLTANKDKIIYKKREIEFLGRSIGEGKIRPLTNQTEAIFKMATPKNVDDLREFLGKVNYYRKFIKNCADKCMPLSNLLKKNVIFEWKEEQQKAFTTLQHEIAGNNCVYLPDYNKEFILTTDASNKGLGAALSQIRDGEERTIGHVSRKLQAAELNYSITKKKCWL